MDLFDYMRENAAQKESPLASRMRPTTLEEVVGQQHIIGQDKLLYRAIKADKLSSIIFMDLLEQERRHSQRLLRTQRVHNLHRSMQQLQGKKIWRRLSVRRKTILACMDRRPFCLSTRSIDLTKDSRTIYCRL